MRRRGRGDTTCWDARPPHPSVTGSVADAHSACASARELDPVPTWPPGHGGTDRWEDGTHRERCTALLDRSRLVDDTAAAVVRLRSSEPCLPFGMHLA
jgi:hypothetical protein